MCGTAVPVEVDRLPLRTREPRAPRLWWAGPGEPRPDPLRRADVRRFALEHTLRFCAQMLGWTTPRVRHPEQADRQTRLVVASYTQLRLGRPIVADRRPPRERPLDPAKPTPSRVCRTVSAPLLAVRRRSRRPPDRGSRPPDCPKPTAPRLNSKRRCPSGFRSGATTPGFWGLCVRLSTNLTAHSLGVHGKRLLGRLDVRRTINCPMTATK